MAYLCKNCNTIHGWEDHPKVMLVKKHHRGPCEDIWWCPKCNREHRTFDGSMMGQFTKMWEEVDPNGPMPTSFIVTPDGKHKWQIFEDGSMKEIR